MEPSVFLKTYQFFCVGITAVCFYQAVANLVSFRVTKQSWILRQGLLAFVSGIFCAQSTVISVGIEHQTVAGIISVSSPVTVVLALILYLRVLADHFQVALPGIRVIRIFL